MEKPEILEKGVALQDWNVDLSCIHCYTKFRINHTHVWSRFENNYHATCPSCELDVRVHPAYLPISVRTIADDDLKQRIKIESTKFWAKFWRQTMVSICIIAGLGGAYLTFYSRHVASVIKINNEN